MSNDTYKDFPRERLNPKGGCISLEDGAVELSIDLIPFEIDGEQIDEVICFDGMAVESDNISAIANTEYNFPSNPEDGYVEGSIYIWSAHNPIDLHSIQFGEIQDGEIAASFDMTFVFEFEGEARNLRITLKTELTLES